MTDQQFESGNDFTLNDEQRKLVSAFGDDLSMMAASFAVAFMGAGLTEARAAGVITNLLIRCAAGSACRTRRVLLGGEPDPARWRDVTDRAFQRAVEYTAAKPTESAEDPLPEGVAERIGAGGEC